MILIILIFLGDQNAPSVTLPPNSESEEEIKVLKTMVHRLNLELSKYQNQKSSNNDITTNHEDLPKVI